MSDGLEERMANIEGGFAQMNKRMDDMNSQFNKRLDDMNSRMNHIETEISNLRAEINNLRAEINNLRAEINNLRIEIVRGLMMNLKWTIGILIPMWVTIILTILLKR